MAVIRNETFQRGSVVYAEIVDTVANTLTVERLGVVGASRPLTAAEISAYNAPLNATAADAQIATAKANLRAYRDLASPTTAQTTATVKLLCRVVLNLLRRLENQYDAAD